MIVACTFLESYLLPPYRSAIRIVQVTSEEKAMWAAFKTEYRREVRDLFADVLRSMSGYSNWWFAVEHKNAERYNEREDISRLSGALGYGQEIMMMLFDIAGLVNQNSGGGYKVNSDEWVSMFAKYELTNELSRTLCKEVFGGKCIYYLRIGRSESRVPVRTQMIDQNLKPPKISRMKISRLMSDTVSKILYDLQSRKDVLSGVDVWRGIDDVVMNEESDDEDLDSEPMVQSCDDVVSSLNKPEWMTSTNVINCDSFPILSRLGSTITDVELSCLLSEVVKFTKDLGKDMEFRYRNGREGLLLEVPKNSSSKYRRFREYSGKSKWLHKLLMHVGGENNNESADEGAYLLSKELCKEYETSVLLAVKENGIPIIEKMDKVTAGVIWSDAQVTFKF